MTKRHVTLPDDARSNREAFVSAVDDRLSSDEPTSEVVAEVLAELNGDRELYDRWNDGGTVSSITEARLRSYDPRNATLESEYYAEKDEDAFAESKPLQWLWRGFDNTSLADNVDVALAFREMLAGHLFADVGENLRLFRGITVTYGHNLTLGDNAVIHDDVHLDDRGELTIGDRVSISDGVHLYSHDHDLVDQTHVRNYHTIVEDDVRVTYDAMVRAGCQIGENSIVGARAVVQGDVPAHHIAVGTPAKSVKIKPGWEDVAEPLDDANPNRQEERRLDDAVPDGIEVFDEFQRDLEPPA